MVDKAGVGFFEIEGVAIVGDRNIASTQQRMKILCKKPVTLEVLFKTWVIRQSPHGDNFFISPTISK
jgi:hypothetical protein